MQRYLGSNIADGELKHETEKTLNTRNSNNSENSNKNFDDEGDGPVEVLQQTDQQLHFYENH